MNATELSKALAEIFALDFVELNSFNFESICKRLALKEPMLKHLAIPIEATEKGLVVAVADPSIIEIENDFRFATGKQIQLVIANCLDIRAALNRLYGENNSEWQSDTKQLTSDDLANLVQVSDAEIDNIEDLSQDDSPVSRFIHQVLMDAVRKKASDIHFEPMSTYIEFACAVMGF